jgi:hypothetical protein
MLAAADGAFVGTFVEKREPDNPQSSLADAVYVFRVDQVVKGSLPARIEVVSATSGASCGLEVSPGDRIGLFLSRDGPSWRSHLCAQIDPQRLLAAARPLPAPNGRGALRLLVGGRAGDVRTIGLDAQGRTLAYGRGRGETLFVAVCPGSKRAVEYASIQPNTSYLLAVRDLATFKVFRERTHRPRKGGRVAAISCRNATGSEVAVFETAEVPLAASRIVVGGRTIWSGKAIAATFAADAAYVSVGVKGTLLTRVDLRTGSATRLATIPAFTGSLSVAPDRRVAGVAYSASIRRTSPPSRVVVYDPAATPRVRSVPLSQSNVTGDLAWSDGRLIFTPHWGADNVRVYDARLRVVGRFGNWLAGSSVVVGGRAYGLARGTLLTASLPRGPAKQLRSLPTPVTNALTATR